MSKEKVVVTIKNLRKYFNDVKAVDGLSLEIRSGEIYGLLGPNGSGKTTTVKNLLGILEPDEGAIKVLGFDPLDQDREVKKLIGYVSEDPLIYKSLTPRELFNFIASIRDLDEKRTHEKIEDLFESLEATQYYDNPIVTLSKGNKQKVQIIAALIHDPKILIMDEPLSGLDARSSRVIKDILKIHISNGGAVLLCTHIMEIAEDLCDRIGILNYGKLIAEGSLEELRKISHEAGAASLEDVFLKLTEQNESINKIVEKLKETLNQ